MNGRIWELKQQAMLFAQEKCDGQTTDMHGNLRSNIWTEKFAELIVRECAHIAWLNSTEDNVSHTVIKQHFGIEE